MKVKPTTAAAAVKWGAKLWRHFKPWKRLTKRVNRARNKRRVKRGEAPLPLAEEVTMDALQGKKTWIGLVTMLLGALLNMFGVGQCSPEALAAATCMPADTIVQMLVALIDQVLIIVGGVMTLWGVLMKELRERKLRAQLAAAGPSKRKG